MKAIYKHYLQIGFTALCVLAATFSFAQAGPVASLKADPPFASIDHVFNIFKFVTWPEASEKSERFVFCVMGKHPFGSTLYKNTQQSVRTQKVRIITDVSAEFAAYCHALYIGDSPQIRENLSATLQALKGKPVLTLSDMNDFTAFGGMVEMHKQSQDKVSISVNQEAASAASLRISSKLLTLSK